MLTKDQAEATSDALLQPALSRQAVDAARLARRQLQLHWGHCLIRCALAGSATGLLVAHWLPKHILACAMVGVTAGAAIGALAARFAFGKPHG
jgi:hypothetical protein